ncbi:MAG: universal stress protein [Verrucomicrobia bacterium]|nr:universal stress protein [Verrucomicrobiota bacterium]
MSSSEPRRILVPVDFSKSSLAALQHALALAQRYDAQLLVLHALEPLHADMLIDVTQAQRDARAAAHERLTKLADATKRVWPRTGRELRTGHPVAIVTAMAKRMNADLIVMGTHGRTGFKRALMGSVAERVVRHAPCPVLTVALRATLTRTDITPAFKLGKILVPIDFSNIAKDALPWATSLAARFDAELILLHVVEKFPIDYLLGRQLTDRTIARLMKRTGAGLERMAGSLSKSTGVHVSAVVRTGTPYGEICQAAKTLGANLIVLTTHGYTGLKHVWLGSTAERVVRHAPCPVLAVR